MKLFWMLFVGGVLVLAWLGLTVFLVFWTSSLKTVPQQLIASLGIIVLDLASIAAFFAYIGKDN